MQNYKICSFGTAVYRSKDPDSKTTKVNGPSQFEQTFLLDHFLPITKTLEKIFSSISAFKHTSTDLIPNPAELFLGVISYNMSQEVEKIAPGFYVQYASQYLGFDCLH